MNLREWALPVYTILMQLAIGALLSLWIIRTLNSSKYGKEKIDQITISACSDHLFYNDLGDHWFAFSFEQTLIYHFWRYVIFVIPG